MPWSKAIWGQLLTTKQLESNGPMAMRAERVVAEFGEVGAVPLKPEIVPRIGAERPLCHEMNSPTPNTNTVSNLDNCICEPQLWYHRTVLNARKKFWLLGRWTFPQALDLVSGASDRPTRAVQFRTDLDRHHSQ